MLKNIHKINCRKQGKQFWRENNYQIFVWVLFTSRNVLHDCFIHDNHMLTPHTCMDCSRKKIFVTPMLSCTGVWVMGGDWFVPGLMELRLTKPASRARGWSWHSLAISEMIEITDIL